MLKSKRIYLRPIIKEDLSFLNRWKNNYEVFKNLGGGFLPISIDQQEKWMDSMIDNTGNSKRFIICLSDSSAIGFIGLYSINWISRTGELGMYIGETSQWGKGYGKEALALLIEFAFNNINIRKIKLNVVEGNQSAIKLYERYGFETVGILKKERFIDGNYVDVRIMELLNNKYQELGQ